MKKLSILLASISFMSTLICFSQEIGSETPERIKLAQKLNDPVGYQLAKPEELKVAENAYIWTCQYVGATNILKTDELVYEGMKIGTTNYAIFKVLDATIPQIDLVGKRYDMKWWDDCTYHSEISESSNSIITLLKFKLANADK